VVAFSHKFSIAPSGETTDRIKTVTGCANVWMVQISSVTVPSMVGIVGRTLAVDEKMLCFFRLFFVTLCSYEVCDNGNAMKQRNFHNNYGVIV